VRESILTSLANIAEVYRNSESMKHALLNYDKVVVGTKITNQLLIKCTTNLKDQNKKLPPIEFL
jgi:hypothetical protein